MKLLVRKNNLEGQMLYKSRDASKNGVKALLSLKMEMTPF